MKVPMRDNLALMAGYHSPQVDVAVRLNVNESPLPPPPEFMARLSQEVLGLGLNRYPDRQALALREALATYHKVTPEEVFCANGSNEVLQCLLLAYGGPGRTAVSFEPTYALHSHIAHVTGTGVFQGKRDEDFCVNEQEMEVVLSQSRPSITFMCSPNNPTGTVDDPAVTERTLQLAPGLVVVDEAYGPFAGTSALAMRSRPGSERLVVVQSFSKTWALAGLRLGYAIADPAVVSALEAVVMPYHLDAFTQAAGRLALEFTDETHARVARIVSERRRVAEELANIGVRQWPSDANFILFRPVGLDGAAVWRALVDRSVLVRDCSSWVGLEGCLRVSIGTPAENDAFLEALAEAVA